MNVVVLFMTSLWFLAGFLSTEDLADCSWGPAEDTLQLKCQFDTLQTGPSHIPQVEKARSLHIKCSDNYLNESVLRPDHFGSLPSLVDLTINFCNVYSVPSRGFIGLNALESLKIQGNNLEWSSNVSFSVSSDTFLNLERLSVLSLADNNLWTIPTGVFCNTPNLQTLNLSHNHIVAFSEIFLTKFNDCQLLHLEELDLSFNQIFNLEPNYFSLVPGLKKLNLHGNYLDFLSDHTFNDLPNLVVLNLSHNSLSSQLLSNKTFSNLFKLVALDLSHNGLTSIKANILSPLNSLQILNLQNNNIATLSSSSFSSLINLHTLVLSHNHLKTIPSTSFSSLASLTSLSLDNNKITSLTPDLFANTSQLQDLNISNNDLQEVPSAISNLTELQNLDLGNNNISSITKQHLNRLINLHDLCLTSNNIEKIAKDVFSNNTNLHVLNISHNKIHTIDQDTFKDLINLTALHINNNQLKDINGLVMSQKNLRWLNVSVNNLQWFDFAFIPISLELIDLHNNSVEEIGNYYEIFNGFNLLTLDASFNRINSVRKTLLASLENIYLNNNNIKDVVPESFSSLSNLSRVELQGNQLTNIQPAHLRTVQTDTAPEFLLGDNPYRCDCSMEWLLSINQVASLGEGFPQVMDVDRIMCSLVSINGDNSSLVPMTDMESTHFMCKWHSHCLANCHCCSFRACPCRMECPEGCSCYRDNSWSSNDIQCSAPTTTRRPSTEASVVSSLWGVGSTTGQEDVASLVPMDGTTVHLDGNSMADLINQGFFDQAGIQERGVRAEYLNNTMQLN